MSNLRQALDDYLALRRSLGYIVMPPADCWPTSSVTY